MDQKAYTLGTYSPVKSVPRTLTVLPTRQVQGTERSEGRLWIREETDEEDDDVDDSGSDSEYDSDLDSELDDEDVEEEARVMWTALDRPVSGQNNAVSDAGSEHSQRIDWNDGAGPTMNFAAFEEQVARLSRELKV